MHRGDIYLVDLNPTKGAEIFKARPCIVVSTDDIGILPLKIVIPLIGYKPSHENKSWLVPLYPNKQNGLSKPSTADALNIRSVSDQRFIKKIGYVEEKSLGRIVDAIGVVLEIT